MKKFHFFALALFGSAVFALDKAGCERLKDVKILHNEMIDAVWNESGEVSADRMSALKRVRHRLRAKAARAVE